MTTSLQSCPETARFELLGIIEELKQSGLDLAAPLQLDIERDDDAQLLREAWAQLNLPAWVSTRLQRGPTGALVIGNTRAIWEPFIARLTKDERLRSHLDPLDTYVERVVHHALLNAQLEVGANVWVGFAHSLQPLPIPIQRIAARAGMAHIGPAGLAIHPTFGPWFALRALIVFLQPIQVQIPSQGESSSCVGCAAPCASALKRARGLAQLRPHRGQENLEKTIPADLSHRSQLWLKVRDACPVGAQHRYSLNQIAYHYDKNRAALRAD